jgi:hypothetical protein
MKQEYLDYLSGENVSIDGGYLENGVAKLKKFDDNGNECFFQVGTITSNKLILDLPGGNIIKDVLDYTKYEHQGHRWKSTATSCFGIHDKDGHYYDSLVCSSCENSSQDTIYFYYSNMDVKFYNQKSEQLLIEDTYHVKTWNYELCLKYGWNLVWEHLITENKERRTSREWKTDLTNIPQNIRWQCVNHH